MWQVSGRQSKVCGSLRGFRFHPPTYDHRTPTSIRAYENAFISSMSFLIEPLPWSSLLRGFIAYWSMINRSSIEQRSTINIWCTVGKGIHITHVYMWNPLADVVRQNNGFYLVIVELWTLAFEPANEKMYLKSCDQRRRSDCASAQYDQCLPCSLLR